MFRRTLFGLAVIAAAIGAGTLSAASSAPSPRAPAPIRVFEHDTTQTNLDLGASGPSTGDQFLFAGDVFNHKGGKKLGRAGGTCTTVSSTEVLCVVNTTLPGGQLAAQGLFRSGPLFGGKTLRYPITGGTGVYRDARGYGTVQIPPNVPNEPDANFVYYLQ